MTQLSESAPKARKPHRCVWCWLEIAVGEVYERWTTVDGGKVETHTAHAVCARLVRKLKMSGPWGDPVSSNDFYDHVEEAYREHVSSGPDNIPLSEMIYQVANHLELLHDEK